MAYVYNGEVWPLEVKWHHQLRAKDIKLMSQFPRAKILTKSHQYSAMANIPMEPLPPALLRLTGDSNE